MAVQTYIDGIDVTSVTLDGSVTRRLNRPSQASARIPIQFAIGDAGSRLKIVIDGTIFFHGFVQVVSDEADENSGYTQYEATDPMEMWSWRVARDHTGPTQGNMITPTFFERLRFGPQIMQEILLQSMDGSDQAIGEGTLFLEMGTFASAPIQNDLSGAPTNYPMTIADIASLLTSTGVVDIVLTPIDSGGNMARVDVYNGDYGTNREGSVIFDFATGAHNVRGMRQVTDMSNVCNKLQYFFGPKETLERYKANITGDDPYLICSCRDQTAVAARRVISRADYGVRMEIQEFDIDVIWQEQRPAGPVVGPVDCNEQDPTRAAYRCLWQTESWIRALPRKLVHFTPIRNEGIGDFDVGDLVAVNAGAYFRGGLSGAQRIYEYTVNWDTEGVMEITELVTSAQQEGGF